MEILAELLFKNCHTNYNFFNTNIIEIFIIIGGGGNNYFGEVNCKNMKTIGFVNVTVGKFTLIYLLNIRILYVLNPLYDKHF